MMRKLIISFLGGLSSVLLLTGCGGGGGGGGSGSNSASGSSTTVSSISGTAVDGYLQGATVFLDANRNGLQDAGEPAGLTDATGSWTLDLNGLSSIGGLPIIVMGGVDRDTGSAFTGRLVTRASSSGSAQVVTPLTSVVNALINGGYATDETIARQMVAQVLRLGNGSNLESDPIAQIGSNTAIYAKQVALQRAVQALGMADQTTTDPYGFESQNRILNKVAEAIARKYNANQTVSSVSDLLGSLDTSGLSKSASVSSAIPSTQTLANSVENTLMVSLESESLSGMNKEQAETRIKLKSGEALKSLDRLQKKVERKYEKEDYSNSWSTNSLASEVENETGRTGVRTLIASNQRSDISSSISSLSRTPNTYVRSANQPTNTAGRLLASNCFQCHGTGGLGGFENIRGSSAREVLDYLQKPARNDIMAAHAQGYTTAQLNAIITYLQQ